MVCSAAGGREANGPGIALEVIAGWREIFPRFYRFQEDYFVIFETARFRVHTTTKSVWVEQRDPDGWVLREQRAIPLSPASLADAAEASALRNAVADYETSHPGDGSLRAVLTGVPEIKKFTARKEPVRIVKPSTRLVPSKRPNAWRQPLRPPIRPAAPAAE